MTVPVCTPVEAASTTKVTYSLTGMQAWGSEDRIVITSSQGLANHFAHFDQAPSIGATEFSGTSDWFSRGLPDAPKGDVVFVYQRATTPIGSGSTATSVSRATRFARLTNLTVADGATATATVRLSAAPQTGSLGLDVRSSQFAALAADVNPGAVVSFTLLSVLGIPHSAAYPEMPSEGTSVVALAPPRTADADYGSVAYGRFLDPFWQEVRRILYFFDVTPAGLDAVLESDVPLSTAAAGPIVPVVGPPKFPRVNGSDAFVAQTGVGLQPTISWSAPALGTPTSYFVDILPAGPIPCSMAGQTAGVNAWIHGTTSFKVPPGMLKAGLTYRATITAVQAPWDALDAGPFRTGTPFHQAQCVTAPFAP